MKKEIKIAYIGGGSRGWAWGLMSDLALADDLCGKVDLYDIDFDAAKANEIIGNRYSDSWNYRATKTIEEALRGADVVIISIMPATLKEMESDVHTPEKYGIYQSVGDTTGPGGIIRAMRCVPMFEEIGVNIKKYAPNAWVINYTNPMTLCVRTLYRVFPEIKAFGCCHEVFDTQKLLARIVNEEFKVNPDREEIKINPVGVNHFTWLTKASWNGHDLFPLYRKFCEKHKDGFCEKVDKNWMNDFFHTEEKVKMDLFLRFGYIAAAGDRHLAEFCPGKWYLENPERVKEMRFGLTPVSWRVGYLEERNEKSRKMLSGEREIEIKHSGEEGVKQIRALMGLTEFITNVNLPNVGQIPNLPLGAVVETNARFNSDGLTPLTAGDVPKEILPLISKVCAQQEALNKAIGERDVNAIFQQFCLDNLVTCGYNEAKKLFDEMCENTKEYLKDYDL